MTQRGFVYLTKKMVQLRGQVLWVPSDPCLKHFKLNSGLLSRPGNGIGNTVPVQLKEGIAQINQTIDILSVLFGKQCNAIAALRIRRTAQIVNKYCTLYTIDLLSVVEKFGHRFIRRIERPLYFLFSVVIFSWEKERILDKELFEQIDELAHIAQTHSVDNIYGTSQCEAKWEKIIDRDNLLLWRKPVTNSYLYEYKVYGTFTDIPARTFYNIQVDLDYRKKWDKLVIQLDIIDKDEETGSEIVRWVTHYPFPMYSREYVYLRKCVIDLERRVMLINSRATNHPSCPPSDNYVRVNTFKSNMVIKPHSSFDENGLDYVLTYFDDPRAAVPSAAYNWMASTGVPDFVNKLHMAALRMNELKYSRTSDGRDCARDNNDKLAM